jgi:hypothetical protein
MKNGGWLDSYDDRLQLGGYVYPTNYVPQAQNGTSIPIIDDVGDFKEGVWVPDLKAMAKQAKKLGVKKVKTKSGSVLYFNDKWEAVGADDAPQAENGIEGTMGGLTDKGFNYNGAWGGPSMQFGGNLAGAVGSMYARVGAPSNGPYAKKTKASAQNGMEMKFYQEGLDWKPKNISKQGSKIKKDDNGYWNPDNWGEPVEINSNEITMQGVYEPLLGISDTGDTQMMYPGEDYKFKGKKVTEYPIKKNGGWLEKYK